MVDDADERAQEQEGDVLPADLQPALVTGPYLFPNNSRRRIPAVLYLICAAALAALVVTGADSPAVNGGLVAAAVLFGVLGVYSLAAGGDLRVDDHDALVAAGVAAGFAVGPASIQLGWRGVLARPTWRILLYSDELPRPTRRALVLVDGFDGTVVDAIVEDNPEDWSDHTSDIEPD
ncbi:MAG: hypothetical protein FJW83_04050 [Actinobacteria bacterium]|nr:hypothetical protein [Actinomycetota bacterium]